MPAGAVAWQTRASNLALVETIAAGRSLSCPDLTAPGFDPTTPSERMLAALLAIGPQVMASGYASMTVDGMLVQFRSLDEYFRALASTRQQVAEEKAALSPCEGGTGARGNRRRILARFTTP